MSKILLKGKVLIPSLVLIVFLSLCYSSLGKGSSNDLVLIPWPVQVERGSGSFELKPDTEILLSRLASDDVVRTAELIRDKIESRTGIRLELKQGEGDRGSGHIHIIHIIGTCPYLAEHGPETYKLKVTHEIEIEISDSHGLFNAGMTLLQLLEKNGERWEIPAVEIFDYPRFQHRGLLLDPARRFDTMEEVKRYVDLISELKMNVFHFHLTDDQGWRLESRKFSRLHEVGGTDGYYTQDQIEEFLEFAAERHVTVIPEIDMPGHSRSMLAAYPELSCSGEDVEVAWWTYWIYKTALCPCREETYEFLDEVLGEVASLFPAEYIHIGNDEVVPKDWLDYPGCQELMEEKGLEGVRGLQSYFVTRVNEILKKHGKGMIAWDETVDYAPGGSIIQSWHGKEPAGKAARAGNQAIVSPFTPWYLSYPWWMWSMKDAYLYDPMPEGLSDEEEELVIGGEACMWQPFREGKAIDTGLFPRILAIAEVLWSPEETREFRDFKKRVGDYRPVLKDRGVKIREWQL